MSVQLILYPQNYNGQFNAVSNVADEKLVDGINFNSINASSSYDAPSLLFNDPITNQPPNIINTWYRWRSTATGTATLPTEISGNLYLYTVSTNVVSGVYQKLSNLVVGQTYILSVAFDNPNNGFIDLIHRNGNNPTSSPSIQSYDLNTWPFDWATLYFGAVTTEDIVQIGYTYGAADAFKITAMSVVPAGTAPTGTNFHLEDGQVICDLYQEEDIPLTLSVDNFKNVAEKVQSYSKDFNLPATKRNNLIFDSIFEITRSDDGIIFNPYIKTQCVLKQDGYILFEGYLRLIDVQDQKGEISYNVNLYSEAVALADVLKDRTFSDLDFTELEHDYDKTEIKRSWRDVGGGASIGYLNPNTSGFRDAYTTLRYPFVDWSHQILLSDGTNGTIDYPELTSLEQAFRPFINIKYLIDRIFQDTPFSWTSDFFDSDDFGKLYMDFNWGADNIPNATESNGYGGVGLGITNVATTSYTPLQLVEFGLAGYILPPNYNILTNIITATTTNEQYNIVYLYDIENSSGSSATVELQWLHNSTPLNYSGVITIAAGATYIWSGTLSVTLQTGDTLQAQFKASTGSAIEQVTGTIGGSSGAIVYFDVSNTNMVNDIILDTLRGETGQWDFLKGILTMFNIVSLPDKDNPLNITFEPYAEIFISDTAGLNLASRSIVHDWTDKVDVSEMKLMPLTDLNKQTIFKFVEDDDDYTFNVYKNSAGGHLYGSKEYDASAFTILEGIDEIIAEPFAATVPKPLFDQFSDFITPAIFTANDEATEFEGFDNSPRIMYNNGIKTLNGGVTYYIPDQNGLTSEDQPEFLQFSHLTDIPTIASTSTVAGTQDFHFGECQLFNPIGDSVPHNLYNLYWSPYYNELYNPNTRIMTMKVNLTPADLNVFKFNDRVMIKNRSFRVNKIDYKPNNLATVEFILIP